MIPLFKAFLLEFWLGFLGVFLTVKGCKIKLDILHLYFNIHRK